MQNDLFGRRVAARQIGTYALTMTRYERGTHIPQHAHAGAFVTVVLGGAYRETVLQQTRDCVRHSIVVHAPGERHADTFSDRLTTCLNVQGATFESSALMTTPATTAMAHKLRQEFRAPDAFSPLVIESVMLELTAVAARHRDDERVPAWLREVHTVIDRRFAEPLTLTELASMVDVHAAHLARQFRRHYGATVGEALRERRVQYAKTRLESDAPLHAIALDAGFADQSHLTRTFRSATGTTPGAFRRRLKR
jgi:AraC family transcriptional regulator